MKHVTDIRAASNIGLAIWRLKCFYETFVQGLTALFLQNQFERGLFLFRSRILSEWEYFRNQQQAVQ
jgi:hypothetical protein